MSKHKKALNPLRIERWHIRDCRAMERVRQGDGGPYAVIDKGGDAVFCNRFANPDVRNGKHHLYIRVRCNDTRCNSTALVHLDTALVAVGINMMKKGDA